jgi:hypothetical protein
MVFVVVHNHGLNSDIEIFKTIDSANAHFRKVLQDYVKEGLDINPNANNGIELFEATNEQDSLYIIEKELR